MIRSILILLTLLPVLAFAQPNQLKEVEVSADRFKSPNYELGKDIIIIKASQLQNFPVLSLEQVLRFVPGVDIQSRNSFGVQSDISLRGGTFSEVLMLIDGVRVNDPLTGHFNCNIPIPVSQIERIEIVKGAASAEFGADAVTGVINIVTKTRASSDSSLKVNGNAGFGDFNLFYGGINLYVKKKNITFEIGTEGRYSKGQKLPTDINNRFAISTTSLAVKAKIGKKSALYYRSSFDYRNFNAQYFYTRSIADKATEVTQLAWNSLGFNHKSNKSNIDVDFSWRYNHDEYKFNPKSKPSVHFTNTFNIQFFHQLNLQKWLKLNYGIQGEAKTIRSNDRGNHKNYRAGLFLGMKFIPVKSLTFQANIREDFDQNFGFEFCPQFSAAWNYKFITIRANGGRTIRAADFTERFISNFLPGPLSAGRNIGNPDLEAERSWSVEGGIDISPIKDFTFSITGFSRWSKNLIDYTTTSYDLIPNNQNLTPGATYFYALNISQVHSKGFEANASLTQSLADVAEAHLQVGYLYAISDLNANLVTKYVSNQTRHLVNGNLVIRILNFQTELAVLYKWRPIDKSDSPTVASKEVILINGAISASLFKQRLALRLQCENLANRIYRDVLGAQLPGRWYSAGLQFKF